MREKTQALHARLLAVLRAKPGLGGAELVKQLEISQPTLSRLVRDLGESILAVGPRMKRRYYLRRALRGASTALPVFAVDIEGAAAQVGTLELAYPDGGVLDVGAMGWPVDEEFKHGFWPGLPYPMQDMRPQGFLGRNFARHVAADLAVSTNPIEWTDEDVLHILTLRGTDTSGNLIVGEAALRAWLEARATQPPALKEHELQSAYADLAEKASALGSAGSSAAGEFPKFTARRELAGADTPHVIVKFSGEEESGAVRRWGDLLTCEHLALRFAGSIGLASARSRVLRVGQRVMLEVERFDRHGDFGRSPMCSLESLDAALINGRMSADWSVLATRMRDQGLISQETASKICYLWWYGRLLGNNDMHKGNLSFVPKGDHFELAPVYDMLPMMYAPLGGGELPKVAYAPVLPVPAQREYWFAAWEAAAEFWEQAAIHPDISEEFRQTCSLNLARLKEYRAHA